MLVWYNDKSPSDASLRTIFSLGRNGGSIQSGVVMFTNSIVQYYNSYDTGYTVSAGNKEGKAIFPRNCWQMAAGTCARTLVVRLSLRMFAFSIECADLLQLCGHLISSSGIKMVSHFILQTSQTTPTLCGLKMVSMLAGYDGGVPPGCADACLARNNDMHCITDVYLGCCTVGAGWCRHELFPRFDSQAGRS